MKRGLVVVAALLLAAAVVTGALLWPSEPEETELESETPSSTATSTSATDVSTAVSTSTSISSETNASTTAATAATTSRDLTPGTMEAQVLAVTATSLSLGNLEDGQAYQVEGDYRDQLFVNEMLIVTYQGREIRADGVYLLDITYIAE